MAKILVIRFSAIGDVAMTIPVIYSLATQYPQHQIMVLSRDTPCPPVQGTVRQCPFPWCGPERGTCRSDGIGMAVQ